LNSKDFSRLRPPRHCPGDLLFAIQFKCTLTWTECS